SAGLVCGSVQAAYTEGDLTANNAIKINGAITNTNPAWSWQVGSDQTDWDTTKLDWQISGKDATADFSAKGSVPVLDGYLSALVPAGGPGLTPVITMTGDGYRVTAGAGTIEQTAEVTAKGLTDARDPTSEVDGKMTFKLVQGTMIAHRLAGNNVVGAAFLPGITSTSYHTTTNVNFKAALNKALDNTRLSTDWAAAPYVSTTPSGVYGNATSFQFANGGSTNILGGFHSNINSARVIFPAATIPETWSAALGVEVAYQ
uniref:F4 family fimbrial subunit n=1 Tax=Citrobacter arsenatis TaxID=2546350 RepID=UPI00300E5228